VLRTIIRGALDVRRLPPGLHKILVEQRANLGRVQEAMDARRRVTKVIERVLSHCGAGADATVRAFVLETSLEAIAHRAVFEQPELIASGEIEREMCRLALRYAHGSL
jgi:hypothetical protein